jgi:hypothetical protein
MEFIFETCDNFDVVDLPDVLLPSLDSFPDFARTRSLIRSRSSCKEQDNQIQSFRFLEMTSNDTNFFSIPLNKVEKLDSEDLMKIKRRQAVQTSERKRRTR